MNQNRNWSWRDTYRSFVTLGKAKTKEECIVWMTQLLDRPNIRGANREEMELFIESLKNGK